MSPLRVCVAASLTAAALFAAPTFAAAAPPPNDNYLASTTIASNTFNDVVDTTQATTQPDLFNPSKEGLPLGGAGPENTTCNGMPFGNTVWYDLQPRDDGGVEIKTAGYDAAVAIYEWNPADSKITKLVRCENNPGATEDVLLDVKGGKAYTFQVGGVNGASGQLTFNLDYFPDADGDGILDALDDCPRTPGIKASGGCPPSLRGKVSPSLSFANAAGGIRITRLTVDGVPKGAKVTAKGGGASQTVTVKRAGRVTLSKLAGRSARAGSTVTLKITLKRSGNGKYKFGAGGVAYKWPVKAGGLGRRVQQCLHVGTGKVERCS
jgi:hypothetical protein